jgi:hypothetical protein
MQASRGREDIAPHSWPRHYMGMSGQRHAPASLYPRYPLYRRLGRASELVWTQRLGEKSVVSAGNRTLVVQFVVNRIIFWINPISKVGYCGNRPLKSTGTASNRMTIDRLRLQHESRRQSGVPCCRLVLTSCAHRWTEHRHVTSCKYTQRRNDCISAVSWFPLHDTTIFIIKHRYTSDI